MNILSKFLRLISRLVLPRAIVIGLDIQDRHLAAVATLRRGDATDVLASGVYDLPEEAVVDGELADPATLQRALMTFLLQVPARRFVNASEYVFILSIPPQHVYTETILLPPMTPRELADAVRLKLETSLPWGAGQAYVDWRTLPSADPKQSSTFIAAVAKATLDTYLDAFQEQKWRIGAVEFHMLSLAKFLDPARARSSLLAIIDEDGIELAAFSSGNIIVHYLQAVPAGTGDVQRLLQNQIKHLASYVESTFGTGIERIFIFDKLNKEYALEHIQNETGIPAQLFTPSPHLDPRLFIAYGASLHSYGSGETAINLLPPELGGRYQEHLVVKTARLWANIFLVYAATLIVVFGTAAAFLWAQARSFATENTVFQVTLDRQLTQAGPLTKEALRFNQLVQTYQRTTSLRTSFGGTLDLVANLVVQQNLTLANTRLVNPHAFTVTVRVPTREAALTFEKSLEGTKKFSDVSIPLTQLTPEKDLVLDVTVSF